MPIETLALGRLETNCYIISCRETRQAAVIDPGDEAEKILTVIANNDLTVSSILLTHGHFDHVCAVAAVKKATGATVYAHENEKLNLASVALQTQFFGFPAPLPFEVDQWLRGGEVVRTGALTLEVLNTPGHSPGGVCFLMGDDLFSGDVLFYESIGRSDLPGGSAEQLLAAIRRQLLVLPDTTRVHPGHGKATTIAHEKKYNPFLQ